MQDVFSIEESFHKWNSMEEIHLNTVIDLVTSEIVGISGTAARRRLNPMFINRLPMACISHTLFQYLILWSTIKRAMRAILSFRFGFCISVLACCEPFLLCQLGALQTSAEPSKVHGFASDCPADTGPAGIRLSAGFVGASCRFNLLAGWAVSLCS